MAGLESAWPKEELASPINVAMTKSVNESSLSGDQQIKRKRYGVHFLPIQLRYRLSCAKLWPCSTWQVSICYPLSLTKHMPFCSYGRMRTMQKVQVKVQ